MPGLCPKGLQSMLYLVWHVEISVRKWFQMTVCIHQLMQMQGLEFGSGQSCCFSELIGEMCDTAVVQHRGDLCQVQAAVQQQLLYLFDALVDDELPKTDLVVFRKDVGQIVVIQVQLVTQIY